MPKKNLLAFCLLLLCAAGKSQDFPSDSALARILQSDALLPLLIDSAVKNSPEIRRQGKNIQLFEQNLRTAQKSILNSVAFTSSYGYGNIGSVGLEKDLTTANQGNYFNTIRSSRYNIGVAIQLPLGSFLSRKNLTRVGELQVEMAQEEREMSLTVIKQEVIKIYQELKLAHAHVLTTAKAKQSASINLNMVQKSFVDGQATVEQLTKMQGEYSVVTMNHDTQLNKFQTSFLLLEAYTGVQLTKLIKRLK